MTGKRHDLRTLVVLALAGFSCGMPLLLVGKCLQAWLTDAGLSLTTISYATLLSLPYSLKFLWAPLLDRVAPPGGRRRGWFGLCVLGLIGAIAAMGGQDPTRDLQALMVVAVLIALISASQDVVIDGYRVEALPLAQQGKGAAVWVVGYRCALLVSGGLGFVLAAQLSWPQVYLLMAVAQAVGLLGWWLLREPATPPPATWRAAVVEPLREYRQRRGVRLALTVAAFAILYKLGDSLAGALTTTFLLTDGGITKATLGWIQNSYGLGATIVGVIIGGWAMPRWGLARSLWVFGIGQVLSNLAYVAFAHWGGGQTLFVVVVTVENLCAGLGTAAFVAFLSGECSPVFAATQYALLSSLMSAGRDVLASSAGACKLWYGFDWPEFFWFTILAGVPGLLLLPWVAPWPKKDSTPSSLDRTSSLDP